MRSSARCRVLRTFASATLGDAAYHHTITLGALVVMLTMLPSSMQVGGLNATDFALEGMLAAVPDLDSLTAELSADEPEPADASADGLPRREIRFEDVAFRYPGTDHDVISGLDLVLEAGRSTAIVGVNGAGKTTLITLLSRLREPTGGRILIDGVPLGSLPPRAWQRQVAAVFQDFARFPLTARENVALDLMGEPVDHEALDRVARRAGATDLVAGLPDGWDTILSERYENGRDLSGGQWQRVALARALYAVERGARRRARDRDRRPRGAPAGGRHLRGDVRAAGRTLRGEETVRPGEWRHIPRVLVGPAWRAAPATLLWSFASTTIAAGRNSVLTDRINAYLMERVAYLVSAAPGLEHLESPDLLGRIDQLRDGRRTLAGAVRQLLGDLFTLATTASTAKELRTYGLTGSLAARHAALSEELRARSVRAALRGALWEGAGWICYAAGFVAVIVVLVLRAAHGHTSPGEVVMAVSLMRRAQVQVAGASDTAGTLAAAIRTARRLLWLERYVEESRAGGEGVAPERLESGIRLEGVSFAYPGADDGVLTGVDLDLPAGSTVAIVGENGAGKTTLAKLLTGMYRPAAGRILIDGVDLSTVPPDLWRARTTAVFQDFMRPSLAARQVVGAGDLPLIDDDETVGAAVKRAGASSVTEGLPEGLGTPLGRWFTGGHDLSSGQWQRLVLARGLMRSGPLLTVLDEPTASLDAVAETRLFERFARMSAAGRAAGGITLLISHRFSTVRTADLIVVLENGVVSEAGDHDDLLARGGTYAQLFTLQARGYARS